MQKNLPNLGRMGNNFAAKNEEIYLCSLLGYEYIHLFFGSFQLPYKYPEITVMHT